MNDEASAAAKKPVTTTASANGTSAAAAAGLFRKSRYKLWAIAAILLLALWSMFTGSVTLKWSGAGNVYNHLSDSFDSPLPDLDILEVEEREKLVRRFWKMYTNSKTMRLPRFWQEAFEAAYEQLTSDDAGSADAAVSEIAKMSLVSADFEQSAVHSRGIRGRRKSTRKGGDNKNAATIGTT